MTVANTSRNIFTESLKYSLLCDFKTGKVKDTRIRFAQENDMETT